MALLPLWFVACGHGAATAPAVPPAPAATEAPAAATPAPAATEAPAAAPTPPPAGDTYPRAKEGPVVQDRPDMAWWRDSMANRDQRMGWFREARFGMFMHWGVYSELGGVWEGEPVKGYAEHIQRIRVIPVDVYTTKVAGSFNPTGFNADTWVRTLKSTGMGYLIITAKHHDGFAMYDSQVSDYNVVKDTPWHHDPMKDLRAACKKYGVHFGFYYSHARDWADGPIEKWDTTKKPEPEAERIRHYVDTKSIPQIRELIQKYDPDIMWFDTPGTLPFEENLKILKAAREAKPTLIVSGRITQGAAHGPEARFGDYLSTTDKPAEFPPHDGDWEAIPTTNESYGWHKMDNSHKPPEHFIGLLAKASARGGNVLLNIGPMGNGKLDPKDVAILGGIGQWMKANGESIHGTQRTPLPVQAWGESTVKGKTLYLHVLTWPAGGKIVVGGLTAKVKSAVALADRKHTKLKIERASDRDLVIQGPATAPDKADSVIALQIDGELTVDPVRLVGTDVPVDTLRAFDGKISGGLSFGNGKTKDAYVQDWKKLDDKIVWSLRTRAPVKYDVAVTYDAEKPSVGGTYEVHVGEQVLKGTVTETPSAPVALGQVALPAGPVDVSVVGTALKGPELFRLRTLILTPVN